jgi:hypothetical protein
MFCPNAVVWGDVATWVAGIATVLTLFFGVFQWFKLRRQTIIDKQVQLEQERRAQARRVFAWLDGAVGSGVVRVGNTSDEPVYNVVVYMVFMDGDKPGTGEEAQYFLEETLRGLESIVQFTGNLIENAAVHPTKQFRAIIQLLPHGTHWIALQVQQDNPGVEIAFTDGAGHHWIRRVTGELIEIEQNALEHYRIVTPVEYTHLLASQPFQS